MIVIISDNAYFISGIKALADSAEKQKNSYNEIVAFSDISTLNERTLSKIKSVIVDHCHQDIKQLAWLMCLKKKITNGNIVFVVKDGFVQDPLENILINTISDITVDFLDAKKRLRNHLRCLNRRNTGYPFRNAVCWFDNDAERMLSKQEDIVLPYILSGLNNKKISQATTFSGSMISHYRRNIYSKLNVKNITELYNLLNSFTAQ